MRSRTMGSARDRDAYMASALSLTSACIMILSPSGEILDINEQGLELLGLADLDEIKGRSLLDFVLAEDADLARLPHSAIVDLGLAKVGPYRYRIQSRRGRSRILEAFSAPLENSKDRTPCILSVVTDVTERELFNQARERAFASERLATLGTLVAGVAHEINNPLLYLLANTEFLLEELEDRANVEPGSIDDSWREAARQAIDGARRICEIVRDLKLLSRSGDDSRGTCDIRRVLDAALSMAAHEIKYKANIVKEYGEAIQVRGSETRLGQVFLNLIINAAQAIESGNLAANRIVIRAEACDQGIAKIVVEDTGSGIPPEARERIFEPFFTTKPQGIGTGLGLPICQTIVRSLGGRIQVDSTPGKGSRFTIFLPTSMANN